MEYCDSSLLYSEFGGDVAPIGVARFAVVLPASCNMAQISSDYIRLRWSRLG
jgi:hypothetical protein